MKVVIDIRVPARCEWKGLLKKVFFFLYFFHFLLLSEDEGAMLQRQRKTSLCCQQMTTWHPGHRDSGVVEELLVMILVLFDRCIWDRLEVVGDGCFAVFYRYSDDRNVVWKAFLKRLKLETLWWYRIPPDLLAEGLPGLTSLWQWPAA